MTLLAQASDRSATASDHDALRPFSSGEGTFAADPRWICTQRVLHSAAFSKAARLSSFLQYVVERSLQGRVEEISEQQIGVHVFGRQADYNPGDDNIVRQTARQLRQRLALYYQEEGASDSLQITLARGAYVPSFHPSPNQEAVPARAPDRQHDDQPPRTAAEHAPAPMAVRTSHRSRIYGYTGLGVLLGFLLTLVAGKLLRRSEEASFGNALLWSVLFSPDKRTIIVPGDAGLNIYGNLAQTQLGVSEYASGAYLSRPGAQPPSGVTWDSLASRRYTTLSDLRFVYALAQLSQVRDARSEIRFARDVHFQDLQDGNAILIGSPNYDPWVQLFQQGLNFTMHYDGAGNRITIANARPRPGEQQIYEWTATDPKRRGYALVTLTDNLQSSGKVLLLEGTSMGGVDAASDFLLHSDNMSPFLRKAKGRQKLENFELLLETTMYLGGSTRARVIASRISTQS